MKAKRVISTLFFTKRQTSKARLKSSRSSSSIRVTGEPAPALGGLSFNVMMDLMRLIPRPLSCKAFFGNLYLIQVEIPRLVGNIE